MIELLKTNPEPLILAAGLTMPKSKPAKLKSFVEIMTKPCKIEKSAKSIDFHATKRRTSTENSAGKNSEVYLCVDFQNSAHSKPAPPTPKPAPADEPETSYQRIRDDDLSAGYWNTDTGEFIHRQATASYQRATML